MAQVGVTHHIKLGTEYLLLRPNTYQKSPAPTFGARISTGDPDYNNLSIWQHWVQKCWVGGMGADEWVDDAMYKDSVGVDTTEHEKVSLGRHLKRGAGSGWTAGGGAMVQTQRFIIFNGVLLGLVGINDPADVADSRLYQYVPSSQSWTAVTMPGSSFYARSIATYDGRLFVGGVQTAGTNVAALYWTTTITASPTWTNVLLPAVTSPDYHQELTCMKAYNGKLYVSFGTVVWRLKDTYDKGGATVADIWDGTTAFYKATANSGSNFISAMEVHLGFLYMLSQNGHLHRTDGNNTFDIWSWDGQVWGFSLRSYDGKLFVGTYEYTDDTVTGYGVLYQFTGAAVTELKRWGQYNKNTAMGQMIVYDRRLFYGASNLFGVRGGFGVACYDAVEDGHSIFAIQDNVSAYPDFDGTGRSWQVQDIIVFDGKMFVFVLDHGIFFTEDSFKDVENGRAQYTLSSYGGELTSSLYDGGTPGLMKLWRKVTVWCYLPASTTSFTLSYSINNGATWTEHANQAGGGTDTQFVYYLNNVRSADFMYRITFWSVDESKSPVLRGVSVAYLPQPEPNWQWSFVIPVADKWHLMDGTEELKNTNALIAYLEALYRSQELIEFIDIDGVKWTISGPGVLMYQMSTLHYDVENPREADVRITLLEAVETY